MVKNSRNVDGTLIGTRKQKNLKINHPLSCKT
jgi:hypothetical protein